MITEFYKEKDYPSGNHRNFIGGAWEEIGQLQYEMLKANGVLPHHKVLDIGCGCLRLGIKLIPYLNKSNYYGIDIVESLIQDGLKKELASDIIKKKAPIFLANGDFQFSDFNTSFDFMIAQSVFTHLPLDRVRQCLIKVKESLKTKGIFFATIFEAPSVGSTTYSEPYYVHPSFYENLSREVGLEYEYIGEWNHPRKQKLLKFSHLS